MLESCNQDNLHKEMAKDLTMLMQLNMQRNELWTEKEGLEMKSREQALDLELLLKRVNLLINLIGELRSLQIRNN